MNTLPRETGQVAVMLGDWTPDALARWQQALRAAGYPLPLVHPDAPHDPQQVRVAVAANPARTDWSRWPHLQFVQSLWAGVDRLMQDPDLPPDLFIARMVDPAMNQAMAETTLWACLALQRDFFEYAAQATQGLWRVHPQRRAQDLPVLVLGAGEMGGTSARVLTQMGFPVTVWRRQSTPLAGLAGLSVVAGPQALPAALAASQVVVNLLPLTRQTHGLIDAAFLAHLPRGAALVNLGRGAHVVDADLQAALDSGALRRAVLDVFHIEPLPSDHPFWRHPQVTVLPHAAAQTDPRSAAARVVANTTRWLQGGEPQHGVDRCAGY